MTGLPVHLPTPLRATMSGAVLVPLVDLNPFHFAGDQVKRSLADAFTSMMMAIWSAEVMRKLDSGNGCAIHPRSRCTYIPTRSSWTAMVDDIETSLRLAF